MSKTITRYICIILGLAIAAFGVVAFVLNSEILIGSATGIGRIMQHFYGIPVSYTVGIINCLLFLLGFIVLGRSFAASTVVCTFAYPIFINIFERMDILKELATDPMLSALFGGVIIGAGMGLVIKFGASTGGTDIIAIILNRTLGIQLSVPMYTIDVVILLSQVIFAKGVEEVLLGIMVTFLYSIVANKIVIAGGSAIQLIIISAEFNEIRNKLTNLVVGTTLLHGESGYLKQQMDIILCVTSSRELNRVKEEILTIDNDAFMIINNINEVNGRGFSFDKGLAKKIRKQQL